MLLLVLACAAPSSEAVPEAPEPVACAETNAPGVLPPPTTVLLVTIDTVHRDFLGTYGDWDLTPRLDALLAEGTRFDHVIATRGLSGPALASIVTGAYPRTHGVRENGLEAAAEGIAADVPTLGERFADAGYRTFGFSSNQCYLLDPEMETLCTWDDEGGAQDEGDDTLTQGLLDALAAVPAGEPVFAWVHLMDPHDPYTAREPWYSTFHPEAYGGPFRDDMHEAITDLMEGRGTYTEADRAYVEAVYASQVAATDARLGQVLDGLAGLGRAEDTVVAFAVDHGEALGRRGSYFYHGCSPYTEVLDVRMGLWAPGRVPAGHVQRARVSSVDFAPTIAELAGLAWDGPGEGRSLLTEVRACAEPRRAAFFERGAETAGVIEDGWSYLLVPEAGYADCQGYDEKQPYPNAPAELYDLGRDPLQLVNLAEVWPGTAARMRGRVCDWVGAGAWTGNDRGNPLVEACAE